MERLGDIYQFTTDGQGDSNASFLPVRGNNVFMEEWLGRTVDEFAAGMARKAGRWAYTRESMMFGDRERVWHTWMLESR